MEDLIEALEILKGYSDSRFPTWCEHDFLHVDVDPDSVSRHDKSRLCELGFDEDEDGEGFSSSRFGSC